jgi:aspartate-semialdehyde dehydrogenase
VAAPVDPKNSESNSGGAGAANPGLESLGSPSCTVIDMTTNVAAAPDRRLAIPAAGIASHPQGAGALGSVFASPHPATIVMARILSRLAGSFLIQGSLAQIFLPASESGPRGIEELQKQTVSLLSFQKFPQKVFGAQLAFNLLGRLSGKHGNETTRMEAAIRQELDQCLAGPIPRPALNFCHAPMFYSLVFSMFVELKDAPSREAVGEALAGPGIAIHSRSEAAPNPVDSAGSGEIQVDAVTADPSRKGGFWIWATVDNIRLAAENAVDIAQSQRLGSQGLKQ